MILQRRYTMYQRTVRVMDLEDIKYRAFMRKFKMKQK